MPTDEKAQIVTSLRVDPDLWKEARKAAIDCDITLGELIDQAIREWIEKRTKKRITDEEAKQIALKYAKPRK